MVYVALQVLLCPAGGGIGAAAWKLNGASANFGLGSYRNYRGW